MNSKNYKKCSTCERILTIDQFHKDKTKKDGHHHCCKVCKNNYTRQYNKVKRFFDKLDISVKMPNYDRKAGSLRIKTRCSICENNVNPGYIVGYLDDRAICRNCVMHDDLINRIEYKEKTTVEMSNDIYDDDIVTYDEEYNEYYATV